jgi:nucleoside-triphosphatase THEP1
MTNQANTTQTQDKKAPGWLLGLTPQMVALQKAFYETRVKHPAMEALLEDLMPLLMPYSESNIIVLVGATGVGKSALTRVLLKTLIAEFDGLMQDDPSTVPLVAVEAYADGDRRHGFKGLYQQMIGELAEPGMGEKSPAEVSQGKVVVKPSSRTTVGALRNMVERGLKERKTRILVVDEAAHMMRFGREAATMDTLKSIANTSGTKIVLVGSFDLFDLIEGHGQIARRTSILNLDRYHIDKPGDREAFRAVVQKLQAKWPSAEVPNFVAISDELMEVSLGCVGLLKSLMLDASAMQLKADGKWNPKFLVKAAKANGLRNVIRREIEVGESKVRDALLGQVLWDDATFSKMVHRMDAPAHA